MNMMHLNTYTQKYFKLIDFFNLKYLLQNDLPYPSSVSVKKNIYNYCILNYCAAFQRKIYS